MTRLSTGVVRPLTERLGLPPFVANRIRYLCDAFEHREWQEYTYIELDGKLSQGYYTAPHSFGNYRSPVNFWIASDDDCEKNIYTPGASCWICPSNHYLFFDPISPDDGRDGSLWCIEYSEALKVIRVRIQPQEASVESFPDF